MCKKQLSAVSCQHQFYMAESVINQIKINRVFSSKTLNFTYDILLYKGGNKSQ